MMARRHLLGLSSFFVKSCLSFGFLVATASVVVAAGGVSLDGSLGQKQGPVGPGLVNGLQTNYLITDTMGKQAGSNLFYSFSQFNIYTGESATFTSPSNASYSNIISRVTGGSPSSIDGVLRCTIDGANLFLLNPYGVMFGPDASLDVKGSFHVSTADYLRFSDGGIFYVDPGKNSLLSVATPEAFGFLNANPAGISTQGGSLQVGTGQTLSVVGGNIDIVGGPSTDLFAPSGRINLASVASPGEVVFNAPNQPPDLAVGSFASLGSITMLGAGVSTSGLSGQPGGTVFIRGGQLIISSTADKESSVSSHTRGNSDGAAVAIDISVTDNLILSGGEIAASSYGAGRAGDIKISAGNVQVGGDPVYSANTDISSRAWSSGPGGNVGITADSMLVEDKAYLSTWAPWTGTGGDIRLNLPGNLQVQNGSWIFAASAGLAKGGNLEVTANDVQLSGNSLPSGTGLSTYTEGANNGGHLGVTAKTLEILDGASITSGTYYYNTYSTGNAGNIDVNADRITIHGSSTPGIYTGIFANSFTSGKAGSVNVVSGDLQMTNNASLQSSALSTGNGGSISVQTGELQMTNYSYLLTGTLSTGAGGSISVQTGNLELQDGSFISTTGYYGAGVGNSGNISITAGNILISGFQSSTDPFGADATGIFSGALNGRGGNVSITSDSLILTNRGSISSSSFGKGAGGDVDVKTGDLQVLNGSGIIASAFGAGNGGDVNITADRLLVSGVNPEPYVNPFEGKTLAVSGIASQAGTAGGNAGQVQIAAGNLQLLDGGEIASNTFGAGNAGNIHINADTVFISGMNANLRQLLIEEGASSTVASEAASSSILVNTLTFLLGNRATGKGGNLYLQAGDLILQDHGLISAEATGPGAGGNINIESTDVQLTNGALISAKSTGSGNAGNIAITVGNTFTSSNSSVSTEAAKSDGGNIQLTAGYMARLIDSTITTSVNGGRTTVGGNITIDPNFIILQDSRIIANAFEGTGGNIRLTAGTYLADPNSIVDASSALGINGTVDISAPVRVISGIITPLPKDFMSAAELLREPCAARIKGGKASSFIVRGRDGVPAEPGGFLPSPSH